MELETNNSQALACTVDNLVTLDCPFCGSQPIYSLDSCEHTWIGAWSKDVKLECCAEMTETFGDLQIGHSTEIDAKNTLIKKWNTRATKLEHEIPKVIEKTEFITATEITVQKVEINFPAVMGAVNKYLEANIIADCKYRCTGVKNASPNDVIHVELQRIEPEYAIDENFDSDADWDTFCEDMAKKLRVRVFDVPYWYHPK